MSAPKRRGRELFAVIRPVLLLTEKLLRLTPRGVRLFFFAVTRHVPGIAGVGLRYSILRSLASAVGENVSVREGVHLLNVENLRVGDNVSFHPMVYLDAFGGIDIGNDVAVAHGVTIMSSSHIMDATDIPIADQGVSLAPTKVSSDVWIGAQAVLVGGVTIGTGAVIAANSVVTRDVPDFAVVAGCPARVLRHRTGRDRDK